MGNELDESNLFNFTIKFEILRLVSFVGGGGVVNERWLSLFIAECYVHDKINEPNRSVSFNSSSTETICIKEHFTPGRWIRFTGSGGAAIPNNPPQPHQCGTINPGWIDGGHPSQSEGVVNRQLCFVNGTDDCEFDSYEISIRNCGKYYVYRPPNITECSLRLCTGTYVCSHKC